MRGGRLLRAVMSALAVCAVAVSVSPALAPAASAAPLESANHYNPVAGTPDKTSEVADLLADFAKYWQAPAQPAAGSAAGGAVLPAGADLLRRNDELLVQLNQQLSANPQQVARALSDSPYLPVLEYAHRDAFGPVLGTYFEDGMHGGKLPLTRRVLEGAVQSTQVAKERFQYPRPFVARERWLPNPDARDAGHNQISGALPVVTREEGTGADGKFYITEMDELYVSGSFPSGHTSDIYSQAVPLAVMVPELAPEILVRASEFANNRLVLGVHYPLDLVGGRVAGTVFGEAFVSAHPRLMERARRELRGYLAARCRVDGYGTSFLECLRNTGAAAAGGYANGAVDAVATVPVRDRESAVRVFTARLTYGFWGAQGSQGSQGVGVADERPAAFSTAVSLLRFAYPELSVRQRERVLELTALPAGSPFAGSAAGWERLNLARALSSQVMLGERGEVLSVVDWPFPDVAYAGGEPVDHAGLWADVRGAVLWAACAVVVSALVIVVVVVVRRVRHRR